MGSRGIILAGSMIVDLLKRVDSYPAPSTLSNITELSYAPGGLVCNCIQDLARMDPSLPLRAAGLVGDDGNGRMLLDILGKYPNIDTSGIKVRGQTSFTDVMYENSGNTRTFFQFAGANKYFDIEDVDLDRTTGDILHIGYILLLAALDSPDPEYGTRLARLLAAAQKKGIKTSVDIVSENSDRYVTTVRPALAYTDYCIINELEAEHTTGIRLSDGKNVIEENIPAALAALRSYGVREWVVIHSKFASYGVDEKGNYVKATVYGVPRKDIVSTTGAGDAFCAGVLLGAYRSLPLGEAMRIGTLAANCSLLTAGASDGVAEISEMEKTAAAWEQPEITVQPFGAAAE